MTVRSIIGAEIQILGTGVAIMETPSTVKLEFGTPPDLHLASRPGFSPGCRVVIILGGTATNLSEDDGLVFTIKDAEDDNGSIDVDTLAPAITDDGARVGEVGYRSILFGLQMQSNRPWLRIEATKNNSTKVTGRAVVLAIPAYL